MELCTQFVFPRVSESSLLCNVQLQNVQVKSVRRCDEKKLFCFLSFKDLDDKANVVSIHHKIYNVSRKVDLDRKMIR